MSASKPSWIIEPEPAKLDLTSSNARPFVYSPILYSSMLYSVTVPAFNVFLMSR